MSAASVALVGVGMMGRGMGLRLLAAGAELVVVGHRRRAVVEELVAAGARECATPGEAGRRCDIVLTCLPDAEVVEQVLLGPDGVVTAGAGTLVVDCSTSDPQRSRRMAATLAGAGVAFVDAPVTGGPAEAAAGALVGLLGGAPEDLARARPVLEAFCRTVHVFGPVGAGHAAKLVSNGIGFGILGVVGEALATAARQGLDLPVLLTAIAASGSQNRVLEGLTPWVLTGDESFPRVTVATARKDLGYYGGLCAESGVPAPVAGAVLAEFDRVLAGISGDRMLPAYAAAVTAAPVPPPA